jgi:CheY-like chemotaxis protein
LHQGSFEALLLDVMLPDLDGFEVCRQVRAESDIPILMLTARGDEMDRIVGLELALVRQIARHHGGVVRCLQREGGGTSFEVELRGSPVPPKHS